MPVARVGCETHISPSRAAIATASARVLGALFPSHALRIEHELNGELSALLRQSVDIPAIERARAMASASRRSLLTRAESDGSDAV